MAGGARTVVRSLVCFGPVGTVGEGLSPRDLRVFDLVAESADVAEDLPVLGVAAHAV